MDYEEKHKLARAFLSVLANPDEATAGAVTSPDMVWSFPGSSRISGEAHGLEQIMKRARTIAEFGVKVEIQHATFDLAGRVSMILHNTAFRNGRNLDERVSAVFTLRGDKIVRLDTYLSDVAMAETFFS
ncbi:nuclear transport factor 2 family protein [Bradyrhizobium sp. Tv2a-2]|uniref:nuclear transport factor 2 family protein n=1 Tax=Bradyrhizobium sp. Tv2a-2 TaxID=113395 RepID=UPI000429DFAB|nr:nuclear transport factor 2 family protein [Bradyrhizobium sp. Tv2a-2]